jgi:hypothetical protein
MARATVVVVGLGMLAACAGLQPVEPRRSPYRSALLNAEFTSAYPRERTADPLRLAASPAPTRAHASHGSRNDLALAEPPRASGERQREQPPRTLDEGDGEAGRPDSAYAPEIAAAYVTAVYLANETVTHDGGSGSPSVIDIYRYAQRRGGIYHSTRPAVGDLVFFHNTYDRNGDGRNNDWYTHVGMVEGVEDDGRISVLSYLDHTVSRTWLSLERPDAAQVGDVVVNTVMRRRSESDPPYTQYLASELFAGFANLLGTRTEFLVIDNWQPGMGVASAD